MIRGKTIQEMMHVKVTTSLGQSTGLSVLNTGDKGQMQPDSTWGRTLGSQKSSTGPQREQVKWETSLSLREVESDFLSPVLYANCTSLSLLIYEFLRRF